MEYEVTIGLETHVQLKTKSKMFCGCSNEFGAAPNTNVCPVCLGYPGTLPVPNAEAIRLTILAGFAIGGQITRRSKFDRKNYFYPDMPKNYQISQYDLPFVGGGKVEFELDGVRKVIGITRIHLEEDVGKLFHFGSTSGIDFNRAGTPLMEIVSEPEMSSADEAFEYLTTLKRLLIYGGVSDCDMEKGQVRCDVNVSIRPKGQKELGVKVEIKNMNTFSGARRALHYEIERQLSVVRNGGHLIQETRRWDDVSGTTESMRTKEKAHDYRYFPEPDMLPFLASDAYLAEVRKQLPELPEAKKQRFMETFKLPEYNARTLSLDQTLSNYFEAAAKDSGNPKAISDWVINDLLRELNGVKKSLEESPIQPDGLRELVSLVDAGKVSSKMAREMFTEMFQTGRKPSEIISQNPGKWTVMGDSAEIEKLCQEAIAANPQSVEAYRGGKANAINAIKGQVMKATKGKASPQIVDEILKKLLG